MDVMPKDIEFSYKSTGHEQKPAHIVYADIECYIQPITNEHLPAAVGCYDIWHNQFPLKEVGKYRSWQGENCIYRFLCNLDTMAQQQYNK